MRRVLPCLLPCLLLLLLGCRYTQPDLSFSDPRYHISADPTVAGTIPADSRPFEAEEYFTMWFWGIVVGRPFHMEAFLKERMGPNRVLTEVRIKSDFKWWHCIVNSLTFSVYKFRTVKITGRMSREIPK